MDSPSLSASPAESVPSAGRPRQVKHPFLTTYVIICIDNMSNEFQECQEFHVHAFILWYNFTDLNIDSIAKQSDF